MAHAAPPESSGTTTALWWASTEDGGALARVAIRSEGHLGLPPGAARQHVAGLVVAGVTRSILAITDESVQQIVWPALRLLAAFGGGGQQERATLAPHAAALAALLTANGALESGGPSWAAAARSLLAGLYTCYVEVVSASTYADDAVGPHVAAGDVRKAFPTPPSNVDDEA